MVVRDCCFSKDGKTIISVSDDKTVKQWNILTGAIIRSIKGHSSSVFSCAISPFDDVILSGSWDRVIIFFYFF